MQTSETQHTLHRIIQRDFAGSQAEFSRQCDLDSAATSRLLAGTRPATIGIVGRVVGVLSPSAATEVVSAYVADLVAALPRPYAVSVRALPQRLGKAVGNARRPIPGN